MRRTPRQIRALKWLLAYLLWFALLIEWNNELFDHIVTHASMEVYLLITLIALLVVGVVQAKG